MGVKLEHGKQYRMRQGGAVTVFRVANGDGFETHDQSKSWTENGNYWSDGMISGFDLIEEVTEEPVTEGKSDGSTASPMATQIGGDHYKNLAIQPMQYSMANGLNACQHTIIKYVTRFRDKGGIVDLEKAKHCIDMLIQFERERGK